jgi:hypothetical protein
MAYTKFVIGIGMRAFVNATLVLRGGCMMVWGENINFVIFVTSFGFVLCKYSVILCLKHIQGL